MPRLVVFVICLFVLGWSASPRLGMLLGAISAVLWAVWIALAVLQLLLAPAAPRRPRR